MARPGDVGRPLEGGGHGHVRPTSMTGRAADPDSTGTTPDAPTGRDLRASPAEGGLAHTGSGTTAQAGHRS